MSSCPELKLDWCSHQAAEYAVMNWHYSRVMPKGKNCYIGVWENGKFIGVVIFGTGCGSSTRGEQYGLAKLFEVGELVRIALTKHEAYVSRIIRIALKLVKKQSPKLRLIVSFADPREGHCGGIYQAANWLYSGQSNRTKLYVDEYGREWHERTTSLSGVKRQFYRFQKCLRRDNATRIIECEGKHRYLWPFDDQIRKSIESLRKPYPKRATSKDSVALGVQPGEGGASPTVALQK